MESVTATPASEPKTWSRKPRKDWPEIQKAWLTGESTEEIAIRFGTTPESIRSKAYQQRWPPKPSDTPEPLHTMNAQRQASIAHTRVKEAAKSAVISEVRRLGPSIPAILKAEMASYLRSALDTTHALHRKVDAKIEGIEDIEEIQRLASTFETVDRIARRTFGFDGPNGQHVTSNANCIAEPWSGSAVIDVTPEPAQLPAVVQEAPIPPSNTP